jgi:HPt (histidine-containing phosphotransfer) domain-containing protein
VTDESPLDRARLLEVSGGLEGFSEELVELFVEDARSRIAAIIEAVRRGDAAEVGREAHSLKGSASNVGAGAMERLSRELEMAARSGDLSGAPGWVDALDAELARVRAALAAGLS